MLPRWCSTTLLVAIGLMFSPQPWPGCPGDGGSEGPRWAALGVQAGMDVC